MGGFIETDVLILGGGIQGLWLLRDFIDKKYSTLLLTHELCSGQTGHSHAFLHEGHIFLKPGAAPKFCVPAQEGNELWRGWLKQSSAVEQFDHDWYVGFPDGARATAFTTSCQVAKLSKLSDVVKPPAVFEGSEGVGKLLRGKATYLSVGSVIQALANEGREFISSCKDVKIVSASDRDVVVSAMIAAGQAVLIRAQALVLAAGPENEPLLRTAGAAQSRPLPATPYQQIIKTYMLVIASAESRLEHVGAFFPSFGGLFIVPRQGPRDAPLWLVGDRQRRVMDGTASWTNFAPGVWFDAVKEHLMTVAPRIMNSPQRYRWGIHEARKAEKWEAGEFAFSYGTEPCGPVQAVWPTLFTLAPLASKSIASSLTRVSPGANRPVPEVWKKTARVPEILEERWRSTQLLLWDDFNESLQA